MDDAYWEKRYSRGRSSGIGSIGNIREWKWNNIDSYVPCINHVIDIGCGDLSFWEGRNCEDYFGLDVSRTIIERNKKNRSNWQFVTGKAEKRIEDLHKDVVFCFDLLFHIMDNNEFIHILENLCYYSKKWIFINTWKNNLFEFRVQFNRIKHFIVKGNISSSLQSLAYLFFTRPNKVTDNKYQYFRPIEKYLYIFEENNFKLIDLKENQDLIHALYIFKKDTK